MNLMIHQQANREELMERTLWTMRQDGSTQPLQGVHLYRHSFPLAQVYSVVEPYVWAVAQDSNEVLFGDRLIRQSEIEISLLLILVYDILSPERSTGCLGE